LRLHSTPVTDSATTRAS